MANTGHLHRILKAPAERVFRALTDPRALVKWMAPNGFIATVHEMDVRPGGGYRMSFTNLGTGESESFHGEYIEVVPGKSLKYTDQFDNPNLPGTINMTITLRETMGLTELKITQENLPDAIPVEMCYLGWQDSLNLLTQLVEAHIPA